MEAIAQSSAVGSFAAALRARSEPVSQRSRVSFPKRVSSISVSHFTHNAVANEVPTFIRGKASRAVVYMAKESASAGYAAALVELGKSTSSLDVIHRDIESLGSLITNPELSKFLSSPLSGDEQKKNVLKALGSDAKFSEYTVNFLNLLVDKRRINLLKEIVLAFEDLYCEVTDTQVAVVTSAVKLENSQLALIAEKLQSMTGAKNIKLKNIVDPSLIAGFIVTYGNDGSLSVDMSVKGQLDRLVSQFELTESPLSAA